MGERFEVGDLPEVDQRMLKRGLCPWCGDTRIVPMEDHDECPECGDTFYGALTIED